ncbi:hypothetical protein OH77DRAFT_1586025 [Trametes cingulata]|nr:hypothetical protein OH77DRAFT_1586025 [Trametes cingulata]
MGKKKNKPTVTCWECKKSFKGEAACQDHARIKRHQWQDPAMKVASASSKAASSGKPIKASATSSKSSNELSISIPSEQDWTCSQCRQCFRGPMTLHLHYKKAHPDTPEPPYAYCAPCRSYLFITPLHFNHSPNHPKCHACRKGFADKAELKRHQCEGTTCHRQAANSPRLAASEDRLIDALPILPFASPVGVDPSEAQDGAEQRIVPGPCAIPLEESGAQVASITQGDATRTAHTSGDVADSLSRIAAKMTAAETGNEDFDDAASIVSYASYEIIDAISPFSTSLPASAQDRTANPQVSRATSVASRIIELLERDYGPEAAKRGQDIFKYSTSSHGPVAEPSNSKANEPSSPTSGTPPLEILTDRPSVIHEQARQIRPLPRRAARGVSQADTGPHLSHGRLETVPDSKTPCGEVQSRSIGSVPAPSTSPAEPLPADLSTTSTGPSGGAASTTRTSKEPRPTTEASWHCRSCRKDHCEDPVTTVCGHIFCHSCILLELASSGCCPVCKKTFLVRLELTV